MQLTIESNSLDSLKAPQHPQNDIMREMTPTVINKAPAEIEFEIRLKIFVENFLK